ncbi:hypothetical protein ADIS_1394 [Lunatimonas lonarensis]|uniref:YTH domain-containing protein n=1 Tax=Lunatimonas lonarensis TaxID=1232681 RepID=R7ZVT4_9BACT|nr:hypothetical protein ADIS_1394 [Lunatimonas lonarensis]
MFTTNGVFFRKIPFFVYDQLMDKSAEKLPIRLYRNKSEINY